MNKYILLFCFAVTIGLLACNKDRAENNGKIQIRVVNKTVLPLSHVTIANKEYGLVAPLKTSVYQGFENITYPPKISFDNNEKVIEYIIGFCGTPPLPETTYLHGKYTYTVVRDNSNPQGFGFTFTQD